MDLISKASSQFPLRASPYLDPAMQGPLWLFHWVGLAYTSPEKLLTAAPGVGLMSMLRLTVSPSTHHWPPYRPSRTRSKSFTALCSPTRTARRAAIDRRL